MKQCSKCGTANADDSRVCVHCAASPEKPAEAQAGETGAVCVRCGKPLKNGMKFCNYCGAPQGIKPPSAAVRCPDCGRDNPKTAAYCLGCGKALRKERAPLDATQTASSVPSRRVGLFAALGAVAFFVTTIVSLVFICTPFLRVTVSMLGESETKTVGGLSMFGSLIGGNSALTSLGVDGVLQRVASVGYWLFAFIFVFYFSATLASLGGTGKARLRTNRRFMTALTVVSLVLMILSLAARGQATSEFADGGELGAAMGYKVSCYMGPVGLFISMLLLFVLSIILEAVYSSNESRHAIRGFAKCKKPIRVLLALGLSAALVVTSIFGIVGLLGGGGKSLVKKYVNAINDRDIEAYAACLYPQGSEEYRMVVASGAAAFPQTTISDWSYETLEKNAYAQRGLFRATVRNAGVSGESRISILVLQKSSRDNKWHVTENYVSTYYNGKAGEGFFNAESVQTTGGAVYNEQGGKAYGLLEVGEQAGAAYTFSSAVSFTLYAFDTKTVIATSIHGIGVYTLTATLASSHAYYLVFDGSATFTGYAEPSGDSPSGDGKDFGTAIVLDIGLTRVTLPANQAGRYYRFTAAESASYKFDTERQAYVSVYDENHTLLVTNDGDGRVQALSHKMTAGDVYYIVLKNSVNSTSTANCTLTVERGSSAVNTDFETAVLIRSGKTNVSVEAADQLLYYLFTPTESAAYRIYTTGNADTRLYLCDAEKRQLAASTTGGTEQNALLSYELTGGAEYYICVTAAAPATFSMTVERTVNDTVDTAAMLSAGETARVFLERAGLTRNLRPARMAAARVPVSGNSAGSANFGYKR